MKIKVQTAIMSHLSDIQDLLTYGLGAQGKGSSLDRINFVKQLVLTYLDTSVEVEEEELNEIWRKSRRFH